MASGPSVKRQTSGAPPERPKRKKKKRRGSYALYYILFHFLIIAACVILSLTVFFKVEAIYVKGTDKYPKQEIVKESGIQLEENLFRIDYKTAKQKILAKFPYIEDVSLDMAFPPSVIINVTQAKPIAMLELSSGEYVLIDHRGMVPVSYTHLDVYKRQAKKMIY